MVVDLQGALQIAPDGMKTYLLTDPAIHYKYRKNDAKKKRQYGRTDLGRRGMRAFFETHKCNGICRLFGFRDKSNEEALERLFRVADLVLQVPDLSIDYLIQSSYEKNRRI